VWSYILMLFLLGFALNFDTSGFSLPRAPARRRPA